MNTLFDPEYKSDEYVAGLEVNHTWQDLTFTGVIGFHDAHVWSQQDYLLAVPSEPFGWGPQFFEFPGSSKDRSGLYDSEFLFDQSNSHVRQWTYEFRVATDFEGPLNFTGGMLFLDYEWDGDYYVWGAGLEAFDRSILLAPPSEGLPKGFSLYDLEPHGSYFLAETHPYELDTRAAFGELYYDLTQSTRVTLGARLTHDRKQVSHRSGNLIVGALSPFEQDATRWTKWTTKVSIDQRVQIPTGDALLYATFSSGYKAGGFNNPVQEGIERQFAPIFEPELIDSYEVGVKSSLLDNRVIINLSGFFYDYEDFQVSKIVSRTSINENIDAEIWGAELETVFQPFPGLRLEAGASYLDTDIQDALSIDTRDPSAGVPGTLALKDFVNNFGNAANSVITDVTKLGGCVLADPVASAAAWLRPGPGLREGPLGQRASVRTRVEPEARRAVHHAVPEHGLRADLPRRPLLAGRDVQSDLQRRARQDQLLVADRCADSSEQSRRAVDARVLGEEHPGQRRRHRALFYRRNVRQLHEPVHSGAARHRRYAASRVLESFWTIPHGRSLARPAVLHQLHVGGLTGGTSGPCGRTRSRCSGPWQCEPQP